MGFPLPAMSASRLSGLLALLLLLLVQDTSSRAIGGDVIPTIYAILKSDPRFSVFVGYLENAVHNHEAAHDIVAALSTEDGSFTVFAPTNEAFGKVPVQMLEEVFADDQLKAKVLHRHVVLGQVWSTEEFQPVSYLPTVGGQVVALNFDKQRNEASVHYLTTKALLTDKDIFGCNGVIHAIDTVLLNMVDWKPTYSEAHGGTRTKHSRVARQADGLGNYQAKGNWQNAWNFIPKVVDTLRQVTTPYPASTTTPRPYQPTTLDPLRIGRAEALPLQSSTSTPLPLQPSTTTPLPYQPSTTTPLPNQHSTTTVKPHQPSSTTPQPRQPSTTTTKAPRSTPNPNQLCFDMISSEPQFSTFFEALNAAGVTGLLRGRGPTTIFAPTNDAWAKLPPQMLKRLLTEGAKGSLINVLVGHVVPRRMFTERDAGYVTLLKTVGGGYLTVSRHDQKMVVSSRQSNAEILMYDLFCSGGVVMAIDRLL